MTRTGGRRRALEAVSALVAFSSFVQELALAQTLTATLGGTLLRYSTTIGLFAFSLGMGAYSYAHAPDRFRSRRAFLVLQVLMVALGAFGPAMVELCDPVARGGVAWLWQVLSYLPVIAIGYVSGFELPLLMDVPRSARGGTRILAADYFGMFMGSMLFPLFLLPLLGVFGAAQAAAACNALAAILFAWSVSSPKSEREPARPEPVEPATRGYEEPGLSAPAAYALILVTSFCSMCFELLVAKFLTELAGDDVLSQSWTIGSYLLGMGIGAWLCARRAGGAPMWTLLKIECALTALGGLTSVLVYGGAAYVELYWKTSLAALAESAAPSVVIAAFLPLALLIGVLSGFELPLLMRSRGLAAKRESGRPLAFAYFGGLFGSFAVPLFLVPVTGPSAGVLLVAFGNFLVCAVLLRAAGVRLLSPRVAWLLPASLALYAAANLGPLAQQAYLKIHYFEIRQFAHDWGALREVGKLIAALGPVRRIETPYQSIDIIDEDVTRKVEGFERDYTLYLNKQPQFSRSTWSSYHEAFAHGAIHLRRQTPETTLILGGGDGLLAGELLRVPGVKSVTLVELDAKMIELAKSEAQLVALNRRSLFDPRTDVVIDDAFRFVRTSPRTYDAIFIDFPYPVSFDLLKLFSREFYSSVRERLNPGGFVVLDGPIWKTLDGGPRPRPAPYEILLSTLREAGFATRFAFGPLDPLVYAEPGGRSVSFDHAKLPPWISNRGFVNMNDLSHLLGDAELRSEYVNSIYKPKRFL